MASQAVSLLPEFAWHPQPEAASLIWGTYQAFIDGLPDIKRFADRLRQHTGTRLIDWIDHIALPASDRWQTQLEQTGFVPTSCEEYVVWRHPEGLFPQVITHAQATRRLAIRIESVAAFLAAQGMENDAAIEGEPLSPLRKARVGAQSADEFWVVERHGYRGWESSTLSAEQIAAIHYFDEAFRNRQRHSAGAEIGESTEIGIATAQRLIRSAVAELGAGRASDLFFEAERLYWTARNRAAQFQKARQDTLGLGWGNHDHHTYRSSRAHFAQLIAVLEELGLVCRERFYAGREAGWGAQVMEQEESQVVVFADVDLSADEVVDDFAHGPLAPQPHFGTVGLWCLLHGEAFLEPGMHHLECRFDFDAARTQLEQAGIRVMKPFTDLPHLKQAFTQGERWPVTEQRLAAALAGEAITVQQAAQFRGDGAVGSHLEILQRDEGYKGFNPSGINEIIRATDPRRALGCQPVTLPMLGEFGAMTGGTSEIPCAMHSGVLPLIEAAAAQFQHELPELLKDRRGQWVVYHGAKLVGFGGTKTDLLQACYSRGYPDDELYVAMIQEDVDVSLEW